MSEESTTNGAFSKQERDAIKAYAKEAREAAKRAKSADSAAADLKSVLDAIAKFPEPDRTIAAKVHQLVTEAAPMLSPKTWYGMPAYANQDGKVVCFFQNASKFKVRYHSLGFNQEANLDAEKMWPVAYAILGLSPEVEVQITDLVKRSAS